jgi:NhaA family Na+:H+ antiporter
MTSEILMFIFFLLIGLEIQEGLDKPKQAILPTLCALGGMVVPALIFKVIFSESHAWAVVMPTDVALAIGALSLLGRKVNPAVRLFLLTLAIADDFFSLVIIGIFFREDLHLASAIYTLGAASIGFLLPKRDVLIRYLSPIATWVIIPIYILINLVSKLDFSLATEKLTMAIVIARVIGKVIGISLIAYLLTQFTRLQLPESLDRKEVIGIGFLSGMGLTVSLVIADITLTNSAELGQVRLGLLFAAVISGLLGVLWLRRFPASL